MTAAPDVNQIAAQVIISASEQTLKGIGVATRDAVASMLRAISNAYKPYLESTFHRVRTIKTFLRPNEPVELLDHYVPASLQVGKNKTISGDALIEKFVSGGRIVVSGIAGRGKSVFLKYMALSLYHNPRGKIPLFMELRALNSTGSKEILPHIHAQYRGGTSVPFKTFISAMRKGYFSLILDGFDEVEPQSRELVEDQILQIEREFPNCPLIVSGRPDERFASWDHFSVYNVCPMTYYKTRKIIEKADYDQEVKKEFLSRLTKQFFERHESFLSTPLLAIMLMLTFADFAEIPSTLHVFYRNAFDTLVRRHDAMKSQFLRTMHSGCSAEQFRKLFASFCALTYSKSKFQFTADEAKRYLELALRQQHISASPDHVLADLIESICLLQIEGFEISFVHRSFQEYFCAVFVSQSPGGAVARYLDGGRYRIFDSVLPMLYAMVPERVEAEWAYPAVTELCQTFEGKDDPHMELFAALFSDLNLGMYMAREILPHFEETKLGHNLSVLYRFYMAHFRPFEEEQEKETSSREQQERQFIEFLNLEGVDTRFEGLKAAFDKSREWKRGERLPTFTCPIGRDDERLLKLAGYYNYVENAVRVLPILRDEIRQRVVREDEFLKEAFGEVI